MTPQRTISSVPHFYTVHKMSVDVRLSDNHHVIVFEDVCEKGFDNGEGFLVFHGQKGGDEVQVVSVQDGRGVPAVAVGQRRNCRVVEKVFFWHNKRWRWPGWREGEGAAAWIVGTLFHLHFGTGHSVAFTQHLGALFVLGANTEVVL